MSLVMPLQRINVEPSVVPMETNVSSGGGKSIKESPKKVKKETQVSLRKQLEKRSRESFGSCGIYLQSYSPLFKHLKLHICKYYVTFNIHLYINGKNIFKKPG